MEGKERKKERERKRDGGKKRTSLQFGLSLNIESQFLTWDKKKKKKTSGEKNGEFSTSQFFEKETVESPRATRRRFPGFVTSPRDVRREREREEREAREKHERRECCEERFFF